MLLVTAVFGGADIEHFHYCRNFYWAELNLMVGLSGRLVRIAREM